MIAAPPLISCNTETTDDVDHRILYFPQVTNTTFAQTKQPLSSPIPTAVIQQYRPPSHPRIPHPPCQIPPLPDQLHAPKIPSDTQYKWFGRRQKEDDASRQTRPKRRSRFAQKKTKIDPHHYKHTKITNNRAGSKQNKGLPTPLQRLVGRQHQSAYCIYCISTYCMEL